MKIKNLHLKGILHLLNELKIESVKDSRLRHRFIRMIMKHIEERYEKERQEIVKHFAELDDKGNYIENEDKTVKFKDGGYVGCMNELEILDNEYFEVELNEQNKDMLLTIHKLIFDDTVIPPLQGYIGLSHDILCEQTEKVVELYNSEESK